ncbi:MAG: hypothetical protein H5T60_04065 [Anaerolineae bacterium]|nr:hypothetical protein [Anaerolineae bacterium]
MMDAAQLAQQVSWLDEQRRRDRTELVALQQRVEAQNAQIMELGKKLQEAEGRLAGMAAQLTRFTLVDQAMAQLKEEVVLMLKREEEQRQLAEREASHVRRTEREAIMKALNDLRLEVQALTKLRDEMDLRKAEDKRLNDVLLELRQNLIDMARQGEEWPKKLSYLEEQRRLDSKRLAQLEQESAELVKAMEQLRGQMELTNGVLSRLESRVNTLWTARDDLKAEYGRLQESLLLGEEERKRQLAKYAEAFEAFGRQMEDFARQFVQFREVFDESRRVLAQFQQLEERLKRDQAQVAELQRLAEERMQKAYEEFVAEDERRWRKHEMAWDQRWNEQERTNAQLKERFAPLEEQVKKLIAQVVELWDVQQAFVRHQSAEVERWIAEFTKRWDERTR